MDACIDRDGAFPRVERLPCLGGAEQVLDVNCQRTSHVVAPPVPDDGKHGGIGTQHFAELREVAFDEKL